jgi:N-acetylmuramoyl-L-alanine amidase
MRRVTIWLGLLLMLLPAGVTTVPLEAAAQRSRQSANSARSTYERALARERQLRGANRAKRAPLSQLRALIRDYEAVPRRFPRSGYADNALWNAANIAYDAHIRFGTREDLETAVRLLQWLVREYPSSSLTKDAHARLRRISKSSPKLVREAPKVAATAPPAKASPEPAPARPPAAAELANANIAVARESDEEASAAGTPSSTKTLAQLVNIQRAVLPEVVRVTLELDSEVAYIEEQLTGPRRLFFDFADTAPAETLTDRTMRFDDGDVVPEIRLGTRPEEGVTRVVLETEGVVRHSLFTLYNPYRLVVDLYRDADTTRRLTQRTAPAAPAVTSVARADTAPAPPPADAVSAARPTTPPPPATEAAEAKAADATLPTLPSGPNAVALPAPAESNSRGAYSLARQLGLGVSRIVIDPGHGGHDPGSLGPGIRESELVLDIALRLEKLLKAEGNIDVVLTRRTDVFVELEERTRIANRHNADLFLSIHANSSRRRTAEGVETYFLNFATTSDAEEVAARENSASRGTMRELPDIVKAITLNNKIDESRDLAEMVQRHIVDRLRRTYSGLPDRGVKQAPFVVLIGASMPSVLAEIGFVSTPSEGQRLKTSKYRDEIAMALRDAILRYQRSLKSVVTQSQE